MPAIVTDQFRIFNANNFVDSILDSSNSYYVFLGLSNPINDTNPGFGRTTTTNWPSDPIDNFQNLSHSKDTILFGKKISSANIRRVVKRNNWVANTRYDMYRHDYSITNQSPNSKQSSLYNSRYYVVNSDLRVYVCIDNGSSGIPGSDSAKGGNSLDEPTFTDTEPSAAGTSGDGYVWKYLFTISPSDIIKFDSTEFIALPNDWSTSTDSQIQSVREAGDSRVNNNQIKKVYIEKSGDSSYQEGSHSLDILGDGSGGVVNVTVSSSGKITKTVVTSGGTGYTYGIVDLGSIQVTTTITLENRAKLIPIIPPSRGHGYDLYTELGADKILIYTRFDDSTPDFPTSTKFSQVGLLKNPSTFADEDTVFDEINFSSAFAMKLSGNPGTTPSVGSIISQGTAKGYVTSYNTQTNVLKYSRDRSLYFGSDTPTNQTDFVGVSSDSKITEFVQGAGNVEPLGIGISSFSGSTAVVNNKVVNLGVNFTNGLANPEINKQTGEIIYIDNRGLVTRDARQKEDVKIILEF